MASRPVSKLETESQLVNRVLGQMNAVKANGQVMQGLVNRRSREKDVFQNIKPVFPALSEDADLSTAQKFAALNLLLERESSGGVDTGLETIGDTVGRFHIKKSNAETIDPAIADMTAAEYKTYIKNNPDKEEALVASFIDTEINSIMKSKGIDTTKLSPNEYAAIVSNLYTSTDQPKLLENTATLTYFRGKAFPERTITNPSDLQTEPEQSIDQPDTGITSNDTQTEPEQFIDQPGNIADTGENSSMDDARKFQNVPILRHFFAEGGVPMNKQMEMFEDGGLMDEGGTIDPVSGNDVPPGSTQEEVRDDIPAQLSEGEFVFPADVVRYIGLGNLMNMRQEAKLGLQVMDKMGQMGNSEEATIPDNLPFDINDLDMEDEPEYNVGGFVPGTQQQQQFGIAGYQQAATPTTGTAQMPVQAASQQFVQPSFVSAPQQAAVPTMQQYKPQDIPTFTQTVGQNPGQYDELKLYRNDAGMEMRIPFKNGQPIYPIPEGYKFVDPEATKAAETTVTPATTQTTSVRQQDDDSSEKQQAEEEAKFGPGGGRLGVAGTIYGVSFDGPGGFKDTVGQVMGRTLGGKDLGPEITVRLQHEDNVLLLNGTEYNELKNKIETHGANSTGKDSPKFYLDQIKGNSEARINAEEVIKNLTMMSRGDGIMDKLGFGDDDPKIKEVIENYREHVEEQITKGNINSKGQIINPFEAGGRGGTGRGTTLGARGRGEDSPSAARDYARSRPAYADILSEKETRKASEKRAAAIEKAPITKASDIPSTSYQPSEEDPPMATGTAQQDFSAPSPGTGSMDAARSYSMNQSSGSSFSSQALGDRTSGRVGFDEGGLASKPKPKKTKKMKRGGLASKK